VLLDDRLRCGGLSGGVEVLAGGLTASLVDRVGGTLFTSTGRSINSANASGGMGCGGINAGRFAIALHADFGSSPIGSSGSGGNGISGGPLGADASMRRATVSGSAIGGSSGTSGGEKKAAALTPPVPLIGKEETGFSHEWQRHTPVAPANTSALAPNRRHGKTCCDSSQPIGAILGDRGASCAARPRVPCVAALENSTVAPMPR
jgi:hypothetical protein